MVRVLGLGYGQVRGGRCVEGGQLSYMANKLPTDATQLAPCPSVRAPADHPSPYTLAAGWGQRRWGHHYGTRPNPACLPAAGKHCKQA